MKVALIKDARFFRRIEQHAATLNAARSGDGIGMIHRCAELHLNHIATSGDPFELGSSRPLTSATGRRTSSSR